MYVLEVTFNLALLACIRQDKEDVLEALLPQVEHNDNGDSYCDHYNHHDQHSDKKASPPSRPSQSKYSKSLFYVTQVDDVNSILKPETKETLLHATASGGSISCAKLLLEVSLS